MKRLARVILLVLALAIFVVSPVLAATFTASITVTETTGDSYAMLPISMPVNNAGLASGGFIDPSALDVQVMDGATQLPSMITSDRTLFAAPQPANSSSSYQLSLGNSLRSTMEIVLGSSGYLEMGPESGLDPYINQATIIASDTQSTTDASTVIVVNIPGWPNLDINTLVLAFITYNSATTTYTPPVGWTVLYTGASGSKTHFALYRYTQSGDIGAFTINTSAPVLSSAVVYTINGATALYEASTSGTSTNPDPPQVAPGIGTQSWLAFSIAATNTVPTNYPAGFAGQTTTNGAGYFTSVATNTLSNASINPGAFTLSASSAWRAATVIVLGGAADDFKFELSGYVLPSSFPYVVGTASVETSGQASGNLDVSIPLPSGLPGDVLIILWTQNFASGSINPIPVGWTQVASDSATSRRVQILAIVATGFEGSSLAATWNPSSVSVTSAAAQVYRVRGATSLPVAALTTGVIDPPNVNFSTGTNNYLCIAAIGSGSNPTGTPSGFESRWDVGQMHSATQASIARNVDPSGWTAAGSQTVAATLVMFAPSALIRAGSNFLVSSLPSGQIEVSLYDPILLTTQTVSKIVGVGEHTITVTYSNLELTLDVGDGNPATIAASLAWRSSSSIWTLMEAAVVPYGYEYRHYITNLGLGEELVLYRVEHMITSSGATALLPNQVAPGTYDATIVWGTNPAGITTTLGPIESTGTFVSTSAQPIGPDIAGNTSGGNVGGYDPNATTSGFGPLGPLLQAAVDSYNANAPGRQVTLTQVYQIMGLAIVVTAIGVVAYMTSMFFLLVIVGGILIVLCSIGVYPWAIFWVTCILMTGVWVLRIHMSPGGM